MPRMELRIRKVDFKSGAKSKGSNGGVAVGLPHRNYSVFKQAAPNKLLVKGRIRMGTGRAPADLHPPLNETKVAKVVVDDRNPGQRSEGPFSRREEGWELGEEKAKEKGGGPAPRPAPEARGYRNVTIELSTHDVASLTENDFIMAAKINQLPVELKK